MRLFNEQSENCDRKPREYTGYMLGQSVLLLYDFGNQPALRNVGVFSVHYRIGFPTRFFRKGECDLYGHRLTSLRRQLGEKLTDWKSLGLPARVS